MPTTPKISDPSVECSAVRDDGVDSLAVQGLDSRAPGPVAQAAGSAAVKSTAPQDSSVPALLPAGVLLVSGPQRGAERR